MSGQGRRPEAEGGGRVCLVLWRVSKELLSQSGEVLGEERSQGPGGPKDSGSTLRKMGAMAGVSTGEMWLHWHF